MLFLSENKKCHYAYEEFPFQRTLSLEYLADYWRDWLESDNPAMKELARTVVDKIDETPELINESEDLSVFEKYEDLLETIMMPVFRKGKRNQQFKLSIAPFNPIPFYGTQKVIGFGDKVREKSYSRHTSNEPIDMQRQMKVFAYLHILKTYYDFEFYEEVTFLMKVVTEEGLLRYYRAVMDLQFLKVLPTEEIRSISDSDLAKIKDDVFDLETLERVIPDGSFEFRGFNIMTIVDVTQPTIVQELNRCLLERDSISDDATFASIEFLFSSLFNMPDLKLGLIPFNEQWDMNDIADLKLIRSLVPLEKAAKLCEVKVDSLYDAVFEENKIVFVDDLLKRENNGIIEETLIELGYRNVVVSPLNYHGKKVGALELASSKPGQLNSSIKIVLNELLSMFATAINRSLFEFETNLQAIIQEQCTAIHQTVEWRFFQAAQKVLNESDDKYIDMEEIVFKDVYPLYALSDIRDSSLHRNRAIQSDLVVHLELAKETLLCAGKKSQLPVLDELIFRINNYIEQVNTMLSSGDELTILEFLRREVESIFPHIRKMDKSVEDQVAKYYSKLNPGIHTIYDKRKDYESSVAMINDTIYNYMETEEIKAQEMFPHYFEKYKTDGVEHNIYVGASMVRNREFDPIYINNLRIWQLMMVCGIACKTNEIKKDIILPLETAHLVLVQNSPLSIRFRYDEKKFDVDGTYNVRYEILKKRIDKAIIKGTKERLTQPGQIAIVYSRNMEAYEYKKYIDYLMHLGYLKGEIEYLQLDDLQGVTGLQAMRVTINLEREKIDQHIKVKDLNKTVHSLVN